MRSGRVVPALFVALAGWSCGDGAGDPNTEAGLQNVMEAIALDFAQVLADVAPDESIAFAVKGAANSAECPDGGGANWSSTGFGQGTLLLSGCNINGVVLSGSLFGFLTSSSEPGFENVSADSLNGNLSISGSANAELQVLALAVSAQLPITDEGTFWQIDAINEQGETFCAWSGAAIGPCPTTIPF